ncbi:hypothetical protein ACWPKO_03060 [Coraliomargarita sp. W4R53]
MPTFDDMKEKKLKFLITLLIMALCLQTSYAQSKGTGQATPTVNDMRDLGLLAANGDLGAIDRLEFICELLYRDVNYDTDDQRVMANLTLMDAAMYPIGKEAGKGSENAMEALIYANSKIELRDFTSDAFGIAAALGNEQAIDILVNHKRHGILLSSAVFALQKSAEKNHPAAVAFLVNVMEDPTSKPLWHGASQGLVGAAALGNQDAIEALEKYSKE